MSKHAKQEQTNSEAIANSSAANASESSQSSNQESSQENNQQSKAYSHIYQNKQKKGMRLSTLVILLVIVSLLAVLGIGFLVYELLYSGSSAETQETTVATKSITKDDLDTATNGDHSVRSADIIPNLMGLISCTLDDALAQIEGGALESSEAGSLGSVKYTLVEISVKNPEDGSDNGFVYLTLDQDGIVTRAQYGVQLSSLGNMTTDFLECLQSDTLNEYLIQAGLGEQTIELGDISASDYEEYTGDVLTSADYTITGTTGGSQVSFTWSLRLLFDYSTYNATQDVNDISRWMYILVK